MTLKEELQQVNVSKPFVDADRRLTRESQAFVEQLIDAVNDADTQKGDDIDDANEQIVTNNVYGQDGQRYFQADAAGIWPVGDPTAELTAIFTGDGIVSDPTTHTVTGQLESATGWVTITDGPQTGDLTSYVRVGGDGTDAGGYARIEHIASGAIAKLTFTAVNPAFSGVSPGK